MLKKAKVQIPIEYKIKIDTGEVDLSYAVIRDRKTGRIVDYTKIYFLDKKLDKEVLAKIGVLGAGIILVGGGIGYCVYKSKRHKTKKRFIQLTEKLQESLNYYLASIRKGELDINIVNDLIFLINEIEKINDSNANINIEFTSENLKNIIKTIYSFTNTVVNNNSDTSQLKKPNENNLNNIKYLKDYLIVQKYLVEEVAKKRMLKSFSVAN